MDCVGQCRLGEEVTMSQLCNPLRYGQNDCICQSDSCQNKIHKFFPVQRFFVLINFIKFLKKINNPYKSVIRFIFTLTQLLN